MDTMERLERLDEALTGHRAPPPRRGPPGPGGPTESRPLWRVIFSKNQFTSGGAIEVVGPGHFQGAALDTLGRRLGIAPSQMVAFGDNVNDLEMLAFAGLGVAIGSSTADAIARPTAWPQRGDEDRIAVTLEALA